MRNELTYLFSNFNSCNFIAHFTGHVIIQPCYDESAPELVEVPHILNSDKFVASESKFWIHKRQTLARPQS